MSTGTHLEHYAYDIVIKKKITIQDDLHDDIHLTSPDEEEVKDKTGMAGDRNRFVFCILKNIHFRGCICILPSFMSRVLYDVAFVSPICDDIFWQLCYPLKCILCKNCKLPRKLKFSIRFLSL